MKKWLNVIFAFVMTFIFCVTMALPAFAAELPEVSIPVSISILGDLPDPAEGYSIVLKADDVSYPMPNGAVNGVYSMTISGEGSQSFSPIIYDRVGIYSYTIYQIPGNNNQCIYDNSVYNLLVTVTNKPDYSGLDTTVVLNLSSSTEKLDGVRFVNKYIYGLISVTMNKNWVDFNNERNTRANFGVTLYADGEKITNEVMLNWNTYEYTWNNLRKYTDDGHLINYTVRETTVPKDYYPVYENNTIINCLVIPRLPTTGLLWWPVLLFGVLGALFVIAGKATKKKHTDD